MTASPAVDLRPVRKADLPYVEARLERNGLPAADVEAHRESLYLCYAGDERVGIGGLERHGRAALLRSVVIDSSVRGRGYGRALCERLLDRGRESGVERVFLLTTTAADFFRRSGFEEIDRDAVPAVIRETNQFADLCPSSAVCMSKALSADGCG
ncbi:arsenic resistance N-acetyltransferase ArsN2 [Haladaptatus salinisoli]|uniref:arsenic resistance N-acetyltransferase ArsN2 n=1 Tax=Haladaptatus salinisoli TaxID=2884876 RepID=UPI001D0AEF87|nr:arsenic resistance N-acetyltransferase ArsN2 [Haladaptatus salinisoli]